MRRGGRDRQTDRYTEIVRELLYSRTYIFTYFCIVFHFRLYSLEPSPPPPPTPPFPLPLTLLGLSCVGEQEASDTEEDGAK